MGGRLGAPPHNAEIIAPSADNFVHVYWLWVLSAIPTYVYVWGRLSATCAFSAVINCRIEMRKRVRMTLAEIFVL